MGFNENELGSVLSGFSTLTILTDAIVATSRTVSTSAAAQIRRMDPSHFMSTGFKSQILSSPHTAGAVQLSVEVHRPAQ